MPLTAGSSSRLLAMTSMYIHEPSPVCRRISSGRNWPGDERALPQLDDPIAVVGVHDVEDALAFGPFAVLVAVDLLHRRARVLQHAVGADHRDDVGDVGHERAQPLLRRPHRLLGLDAVGDVARVRDDALHGRIVAVVGRDHLDPAQLAVGAGSEAGSSRTFPGVRRSRSKSASTAGRSSAQSRGRTRRRDRLRDPGPRIAMHSGCDTSRDRRRR